MLSRQSLVDRAGLDGLALKPTEVDLASLERLPADQVAVDYEGAAAVPSPATLESLAEQTTLRVTVPVRADGFDPLGDDRRWAELPADAAVALVAGNPAYLTADERRRRIAPRLAAAVDRASDAWVGTEGIERLALATGATQFELLGPDTERRVRDLRDAGFEGGIAVYAPTVLVADEDAVLDAVGAYVGRRRSVAESLPPGASTDCSVTGRAREVLVAGCEDYAITGGLEGVRARIQRLRAAGVDHVIGYPARGLDAIRSEPRDDPSAPN